MVKVLYTYIHTSVLSQPLSLCGVCLSRFSHLYLLSCVKKSWMERELNEWVSEYING